MSIRIDIKELVDNQVIDQLTADRIANYYKTKKSGFNVSSINVSTIISVVAAILVGFGMISIIAYNWDDLPKLLRIIIGLIPWLATSYGCFYTLKNKTDNKNWTEAMALLQTAGFTSSVSIINQIYQVQLDWYEFVQILILAALPFVFILRSTILSTFLISATCWACFNSFDKNGQNLFFEITMYVVLLADILFLYYNYYHKSEKFLCNLRVGLLPIFLVYFFFATMLVWKKYVFIHLDINKQVWGCFLPIFASVFYIVYEWVNKCDKIQSDGGPLKKYFYLLLPSSLAIYSLVEIENQFKAPDYAILAISSIPIFLSIGIKLKNGEIPHWQTWIGLVVAIIAALCGEKNFITSLIFLAMVAAGLYKTYKNFDTRKLKFNWLLLAVWFVILLFNINKHEFENCIGTICLVFASLSYAIYDSKTRNDKTTGIEKFCRLNFYLLFFPTILYFSKEGCERQMNSEYVVSSIIGIIVATIFAYMFTKKSLMQWQTSVGIISALVIPLLGDNCAIISLLSLSIIGYSLYTSCNDYDLLKMNISIISLFAWVFIVLGNFDLPFFIYGFILILLGVGLIIMNRFIINKKRSHETTENR